MRRTREAYENAFLAERLNVYPVIDEFERAQGYALERPRLESAALTLACPVKVNPPNWQHGRVIYAAARAYLARAREPVTFLDIGTAKGFSAVVMAWAIRDAGAQGCSVISIDVTQPDERIERNSVAELDGLMAVKEFVMPFLTHADDVRFIGGGSCAWFAASLNRARRIGFAFIDGKHSYENVTLELHALKQVQLFGDVIVCDDVQLSDVWRAVSRVRDYAKQWVYLSKQRQYMVANRC